MLESMKTYIHDQIALVKLEGIEAVGSMISRIVFLLLIVLFILFFLLLLSIAGALYLGDMYGEANGFFIVTGIYFALILIMVIFKKSIQNLIVDIAIAASMADKNDK